MSTLRYVNALYRTAPRKVWLFRAAIWPYLHRRNRTVVASDGTSLSVRRSGRGVPILFVHGGLSSKDDAFLFVEAALSDDFETWSYDRRGRGQSGDSEDYSLEKEVQDLLSVIGAIGAPPHVVAHSFGAILALLAAQSGAPVRSLVLYEPPLNQFERDEALVGQVDAAVARGDLDRAVRTFYRLADVPAEEVRLLSGVPPIWEQLRRAVRVVPRELEAIAGWRLDPSRWSIDDVPMLLVSGGDTRDPVFPTVDDLHSAFPGAGSVVIPGQRHLATGFAPWRFTDEVRRFVTRH